MDSNEEDKNKCPFCSEEIPKESVKCPHCAEPLLAENIKKTLIKNNIYSLIGMPDIIFKILISIACIVFLYLTFQYFDNNRYQYLSEESKEDVTLLDKRTGTLFICSYKNDRCAVFNITKGTIKYSELKDVTSDKVRKELNMDK